MADTVHIVVEKGLDTGMKITVPPDGARLGRSSRNDVTLNDEQLSRHHCRLFFKTGHRLCITDLGSANGTLVNDSEVTEQALKVGDVITLGDSQLKVLDLAAPPAGTTQPLPAPTPSVFSDAPMAATQLIEPAPPTPVSLSDPTEEPKHARSVVDLGLNAKASQSPRVQAVPNRKILYALLGIVTLLAILAWVHKVTKPTEERTSSSDPSLLQQAEDLTLDIDYEKIQATDQNIFRYHLRLKNNAMLIVKIDDLEHGRHVRKEKELGPELLEELAAAIKEADFFGLEQQYAGIQPNVLDQWDMTITIGKETHRSKVINRVRPDAFEKVSDIIENFGKNELGLWAIQFSTEKLTEMAEDSLQDGRKLYDTRDVAYGNLSASIRKLTESEWYLETVEPKPAFYRDILTLIKDCKFELHTRYEDAHFRAARAIKMRQWREAASELSIIREMVPDRADKRYKEATKSLLEVERRIKTGT